MAQNRTPFLDELLPDSTEPDPVQFALQWDAAIEVLALIVLVSFVVERVLAVVFESKQFLAYRAKCRKDQRSSNKELIAYASAALVCIFWNIDLMAVLLSHGHQSLLGQLLTAGVVAGGSKASVKLFRDVIGFKSSAYSEYEQWKKKQPTKFEPDKTP